MKSLISILVTLLLSAGMAEVAAQTVSGVVRDAQTREPLAGATVIQAGTEHGTTTNARGLYELTLVNRGETAVEFRFLGYEPQRVRVNWSGERQENISLLPATIVSEDVLVEAFRVDERSPVTYTNVTREEIEQRNFGQDIPVLLEMSPSVISSSDAGAGIGYTGVRIRGVDPQRINVTVNGIPLNDSESHGVFWVNMPDFASSLDQVQIQRGVGTSAHGPAAFGATVNLQTTTLQADPYGEINSSAGAFNTFKSNMLVGTGLMANGWAFDGRLSYITSDGYIERASSDLRSFFISGTRHTDDGLLKLNVFSGQETTYQAWYGVHEDMLDENRRFNPAGMYTGPDGETRFYDNQTDNYTQTHYQLHYSRRLTDRFSGNISLHYTRGAGYYEEYRQNNALSAYGFDPVEIGSETIERTDLVRQRWLDNHFGGATFSTEYQGSDRWQLTFGGGLNYYDGDHFGEIVWTRLASPAELGERYYDNTGTKWDGNLYSKAVIDLSKRLSMLADIQVRHIDYTLDGINNDQRVLDDRHRFTFVNPKTGFTYSLGDMGRIYGYFGVSSKEPVRRDFTDATETYQPKYETLYNMEAGYRGGWNVLRLGFNVYYMRYDNQLINTGDINDVGDPVRTNVPDSYRAGIELEASARITSGLHWNGNLTLSRNRIPEFVERIDRYDENWAFAGQEEFLHENTSIAFSPSVISASRLTWQRGRARINWYSRYVGRQYMDNTSNTDRALDPWWINDLRFAWEQGRLGFMRNVRLQVMVNNVLDRTYESNGYTFGYFAAGQEVRENYYFPQAGRHVLAGISISF